MMKAFFIDARNRVISEIDYEYSTMTRYLPGGISIGAVFDTGDVLYVDDEAMMHKADRGFCVRQRPDGQPMMSDGLLTGPDAATGTTTLPPQMTATDLSARIKWLTLEEALDWFRARANVPAVTITADGRTEVLSTWADFLGMME